MEYENDPADPQAPTDGPDPQPPEGSEPDRDPEEVIAENVKLREELRQASAERLGAQHNLPPSFVEILAATDRDKQDQAAQKFADELAQHYPAPAGPAPAGPSPAAPAGPTAPPAAAPEADPEDQLIEQIRGISNERDLHDLQVKVGRERTGREPGDVPGLREAKTFEDVLALQEQARKDG